MIFTFIVYFAGFATAIYFLAPPPDGEVTKSTSQNDGPHAKFDSQEFVQSFNTGMRKCLDFGKEAAQRTAKILKEKAKEINDT